MTDGMEWHADAKRHLNHVGAAEYEAQRGAWRRSPKRFRFTPSEYMRNLIACLDRNDEAAFMAARRERA